MLFSRNNVLYNEEAISSVSRFDITLRYEQSARDSISALQSLSVNTPGGSLIPLSELATIKVNQGASRISREENMRRIAIKCNLLNRDQGSFVAEAQQKVASQVVLPLGLSYRLERPV
jgi:cobalt-zinc-cadmium resistance protein CzcA